MKLRLPTRGESPRCLALSMPFVDLTPAVSPVHTDPSGLPPTIVHTAGLDSLRPDGLALVEAARAAGVVVEHTDDAGLWHVFHLLAGYLAAGDECVADLVAAIDGQP